jgi:hypothetical protein
MSDLSLDIAPTLEVPVFRANIIDEEDSRADVDEDCNSSSGDDTKKSFYFTGGLKKLNESVVQTVGALLNS